MELVSSSILGPLCERVANAALEEYRSASNVEEEIRSLHTTVSFIKGVLEDAERKQFEDAQISAWLKELEQVLLDAEDILDEVATDEAIRRGNEGSTGSTTTTRMAKVRRVIPRLPGLLRRSSTSHDIAKQIENVKKRLNHISRLKDRLGLERAPAEYGWSAMGTQRKLETCSLLADEAHIFGRESEKQKLEKLLLESEETDHTTSRARNVHVISVVGMGGVGKTTLVKHAFNNPTVAQYFQLRMWVCVSNGFDVKRITAEIMDAASISEKAKEPCERPNWDSTRRILQSKLQERRFLLVLDDVWEEDRSKWDNLCIPLTSGKKGSKIILTTRSQKVSRITMSTTISLRGLRSEDLWPIFRRYAFHDYDPDEHPQLTLLGRQIVEKLGGLPLAAKTVGGLLYSNPDVRHWMNIMKSKAWTLLCENEDNILSILKLSYDHLPGNLKQCFAYCSLFPEDYRFDKDELVPLWMAQQFIQTREGLHAESEGGECLDNLAYISLFERYPVGSEYVMHDLIHNLAELVSKDDCIRVDDSCHKKVIPETIRHVSIATKGFDPMKIEEELCKHESLRTLLFLRGCMFQLDAHLDTIFTRLRRLRVLGLSDCKIKDLPESIGSLKHLRFLDLSSNGLISKLPESLCNLHNLQVLNLKGCRRISALPENVSALINLRHLVTDEHKGFASSIRGLGRLTALHELSFDCGRQPMEELAHMSMLRQLSIWSLEDVESREEAMDSRLDRKENLDLLTLGWRGTRSVGDHLINPGIEAEVVNCLRPANSIRRLIIYWYGGIRSPSWMEDQLWICSSFLERIDLVNCENWEVLPPLGLLPCLKTLRITGMNRVKRIGPPFMGCSSDTAGDHRTSVVPPQGMFPSLESLIFYNLEEWEEWEVPSRHSPPFLPRLRKLRIYGCPKLGQLPPLPPTLTELQISCVGIAELPGWLPPSSSSPLSSSCSSSLASLSSLEISDCPILTSLRRGLLCNPLPNLGELEIERCQSLVFLPETAFGNLTSLEKLSVRDCPKLRWPTCESSEVKDTLPTSLESFIIKEVSSEAGGHMLQVLITGSQKLTRLTELSIEGYCIPPPLIPPLAGDNTSLPSSLQRLTIYRNGNLDTKSLSAWLQGLTSLKSLTISLCPAVASLPEAEVLSKLRALDTLHISSMEGLKSFGGGIHALTSLENLSIGGCPELSDVAAVDPPPSSSSMPLSRSGSSIGMSTRLRALTIREGNPHQIKTWLLQCPSLQSLTIRDCPQLTSFSSDDMEMDLGAALLNLSPTLNSLIIWKCENLRSLPSNLRNLSSLNSLRISSCPGIHRLPAGGLPDSLQVLRITQCPPLVERCRKGGEGSDWPLISHIPELSIW